MPKTPTPIFVAKLAGGLPYQSVQEITRQLTERLPGWTVFVCSSSKVEGTDIEFECYSVNNAIVSDLDQLKKELLENFKTNIS